MDEDADRASPPCFAHELVGGHPVDPQTARDVARFRKAERERLYARRRGVPRDETARQADAVARLLHRLVAPGPGMVVSVYWPIRGELDLRGWMSEARIAGARIVLPVAARPAAPLAFREWAPGCRMERGLWNIPVPAGGEPLVPDVVIAPLVGLDREGFRLGNGGGYFDRTLAAMAPLPLRVGVGQDFVRIPTIYPMPWDIPMEFAVLGDGTLTPFGGATENLRRKARP